MEDTRSNTADGPQIDLLYRPEQYWMTPDPTFPLLAAIADADKRKRAEQLARTFDREAIVALNEQDHLTNEEVEFYRGLGLYVFDEEYENEAFLEEPLEIAKIGFDVGGGFTTGSFSVAVIVKRFVGQAAYRLQGQGEAPEDFPFDDTEQTSIEDPWYLLEANQPLTFDEVTGLLEEGLPHGGVLEWLTGWWDYTEEKTEDALALYDLNIGVRSDFYPQLGEWFYGEVEAWQQSVRDSGDLHVEEA